MLIIQDTREQTPLEFKESSWISKLEFGDYACRMSDGFLIPIVFERKSIGDLFGTMSNGYERFKREIIRCQKANNTMILIVEGSLSDVLSGYEFSKRSGFSVASQMFTLFIKYNITPVFCSGSYEAARYIEMYYTAYEKKYWVEKNSILDK